MLLLGLPSDLLMETPIDVFETMVLYSATLRDGYDDATNGALVRSTMSAYLQQDEGLRGKLLERIEKSVSKVFFQTAFRVPNDKAERMGVVPNALDYAIFTAFNMVAVPRVAAHMVAARVPGLNEIADRRLVRMIDELLVSYGHAEYTTDPAKYKTDDAGHGSPHAGHSPHGAMPHPA